MKRRWSLCLGGAVWTIVSGCAHTARRPEPVPIEEGVFRAADHPSAASPFKVPLALESEPTPAPPELIGPQPIAIYIGRALAENRTVQAAFHNVQALKHRIPQVTALEDPVAANTIFPIPGVAPQY